MMGDTFGDGESNERPPHRVTIDDFYILNHEVTNKEYFEFVRETKGHYPVWMTSLDPITIDYSCDREFLKMKHALTAEAHPVVGVSWEDALAYC